MRRPRSLRGGGAALLAALIAAAVGVAGCSGGGSTLRISAAASLRTAFSDYAARLGPERVSLSFAGSDLLAAQIREGAAPDVFASANIALPDQLHAAGLLDAPVVFAFNRLVIAIPAGSDRVRSLAGLARPGVTIAAGSATVPVGIYTRRVLARLPASERAAILANVRSTEPDVAGIVGKLTQGAVDAGFVYATDVRAAGGSLTAIELPPRLNPSTPYAAGVIVHSPQRAAAAAFIDGLLHGAGRQALTRAGFVPPPSANP